LNGPEEVLNHPFFAGVDWEKLRKKEYELSTKPEKNRAEQLAEIEEEGTMLEEEAAKRVWYGGGKGGDAGKFMSDWQFKAFGQDAKKEEGEEKKEEEMNVDRK